MSIFVRQMLNKIGSIVCNQLPFILVFLVLIGANVHGHVFIKHDMSFSEIIFDYSWILVVAYIIALLINWLNSTVFKGLCYTAVIVVFAAATYLNITLRTNVNAEILQLLFDTNTTECLEFFSLLSGQKVVYELLGGIAILVIFVVFLERYYKSHIIRHQKIIGLISFLVLLSGALSILSFCRLYYNKEVKSYEAWCESHFTGNNVMAHTAKSLFYMHLSDGVNSIKITKSLVNSGDVQCNQHDSLTIVLVIGESYNKQHATIYGYPLLTTPFMKHEFEEGRLFRFDHVSTTSNKTTTALRNIFSCNSVDDGQNWSDYPFMPAVIRRGGYNVWFWDNQHEAGIKTGGSSVDLDAYLYHKELKELSYTQINSKNFEYDCELIDDFRMHYKPSAKDFLIFHLKGQHFLYKNRYPASNARFHADSIRRHESWITKGKRQVIAEYDNATLYNDMVVQKIAMGLAHERSILIYLSDHGEEVYDYRDYQGRECLNDTTVLQWKKNVMEVPFIVWFSNKYLQDYPDLAEKMTQFQDTHFSTDNLCHVLFGLAGITSDCYNESKNFINSDYATDN